MCTIMAWLDFRAIMKTKWIYPRFHLWAHKHFVKSVPDPFHGIFCLAGATSFTISSQCGCMNFIFLPFDHITKIVLLGKYSQCLEIIQKLDLNNFQWSDICSQNFTQYLPKLTETFLWANKILSPQFTYCWYEHLGSRWVRFEPFLSNYKGSEWI